MGRRRTKGVFQGIVILIAIIWGAFRKLTSGIDSKDVANFALVIGIIGAIYICGNLLIAVIRWISWRVKQRQHVRALRAEEEQRIKALRALKISQVDTMSGTDFEEYLCLLLEHQGYSVKRTGSSGDMGVDLVAAKPNLRYAIQAKRHNSDVSRTAVSDAVAAMTHYGCNAAMVITNSRFTKGAVKLAQSNKCTLVDRDALAAWITKFQVNAS